jgi:hypothetical protein
VRPLIRRGGNTVNLEIKVSDQLSAISGQPYTIGMEISLNTDLVVEGRLPDSRRKKLKADS